MGKSERAISSTIATIRIAREGTPYSYSNVVLKFITDFTTATKKRIATHSTGHPIWKITLLECFHFCNREAVLSRDTPYQQQGLKKILIFHFQKLTQSLNLIFIIQMKHGRRFVKNGRDSRSSTFTRHGLVYSEGGCDGECCPCAVKPIRIESMCEEQNLGIAYITP